MERLGRLFSHINRGILVHFSPVEQMVLNISLLLLQPGFVTRVLDRNTFH